jgi:hypothetical protein
MPIDSGLTIGCADLQAVGGIRQILLTDLTNVSGVTPASLNATHTVTSFTTTIPWARFEFKNETAAMTINGTKENGSTAYECGLNFYLPNITGAKFHELANLSLDTGACIVALVQMNSGTMFLVGFSYQYEALGNGGDDYVRNQTYANLTTIEGGSGSAYADDNGVTVSLMARQFDLPLEYTGTITIAAGDETATTT